MSLGLATIILTGVGANWAVPGIYTQVNFAAGPTTGAPAGQTVLIMGNRTTSGTATVDTVVYGPETRGKNFAMSLINYFVFTLHLPPTTRP